MPPFSGFPQTNFGVTMGSVHRPVVVAEINGKGR